MIIPRHLLLFPNGTPLNIISELIIDAYGCEADLSDAATIAKAAAAAVESVGATVAETACHRFQPHGITVCLILKESHFVVSTWPEHGTAVVNIFLCNPLMDTKEVWRHFSKALRPSEVVLHTVKHSLATPPKKKSTRVA